jgi:hypothetical protein
VDKLANLLRQGADKLINLPTEAQRFVTNPQAFVQLLTGKNALPRETGFAAGATGLPAQQGTVLDPSYQAYMQGYEQGEPISYAAMATPAALPVAKALAPKAGQMAENYMVNQGFMPSLIAYHGTPHTIKGKFDINKVGTGEGAQAYGHGMYFAENPLVAKEYQNMVRAEINGKSFVPSPFDAEFGALNELHKAVNNYAKAKSVLEQRAANQKIDLSPEIQALQKMEEQGVKANLGNLYKVDIPDEYIPKMLDYDRPIKEQPELYELVRNSITDPDLRKTFEFNANYGISGANVYQNYLGGKTPAEKSANALALGIKGIKYKDAGSRKLGEGTNNFVVFDPTEVKILEQNSKPITRKEIIEQELEKVSK